MHKISPIKTNLLEDNLLHDTIIALADENLGQDHVFWVGIGDKYCTWDEFSKIAKDCWYDRGLGIQYINGGLKIVGRDWWMERHEYDGSESWQFKTMPTKPLLQGITFKDLAEEI